MIIERNGRPTPYGDAERVKKIVSDKLGLDNETAKIELVITIGFNGKRFLSSTEWFYQNEDEICIFPLNHVPQYRTFVNIMAGMNVHPESGHQNWYMTRDDMAAEVKIGEKTFTFRKGEPLMVKISDGEVILSDCVVEVSDDTDHRIYNVVTEGAKYGNFENKIISYRG